MEPGSSISALSSRWNTISSSLRARRSEMLLRRSISGISRSLIRISSPLCVRRVSTARAVSRSSDALSAGAPCEASIPKNSSICVRDDFAERCLFGVIPNVWSPTRSRWFTRSSPSEAARMAPYSCLLTVFSQRPAHGVGDIQQNGAFQACFRLETFDEEFAGARVEPPVDFRRVVGGFVVAVVEKFRAETAPGSNGGAPGGCRQGPHVRSGRAFQAL